MSPLSVPNFTPIGVRIRVLWWLLQSVQKEVEEKNEEKRWGLFHGTEQNDGLNHGTEHFLQLKLVTYHC